MNNIEEPVMKLPEFLQRKLDDLHSHPSKGAARWFAYLVIRYLMKDNKTANLVFRLLGE